MELVAPWLNCPLEELDESVELSVELTPPAPEDMPVPLTLPWLEEVVVSADAPSGVRGFGLSWAVGFAEADASLDVELADAPVMLFDELGDVGGTDLGSVWFGKLRVPAVPPGLPASIVELAVVLLELVVASVWLE